MPICPLSKKNPIFFIGFVGNKHLPARNKEEPEEMMKYIIIVICFFFGLPEIESTLNLTNVIYTT